MNSKMHPQIPNLKKNLHQPHLLLNPHLLHLLFNPHLLHLLLLVLHVVIVVNIIINGFLLVLTDVMDILLCNRLKMNVAKTHHVMVSLIAVIMIIRHPLIMI
jgi:hypothetical protein